MKKTLFGVLWIVGVLALNSWSDGKGVAGTIGAGEQPQISLDTKGTIRVVFGQKDKIFCARSGDGGVTFTKPVLVAAVQGMHLGMSRGPQIASSRNISVITAMDKSGSIRWFRCNNGSNVWKDMGILNDVNGSAPEGLMGITADNDDHFYAVWLDTRTGKRNEVYFSSLSGKSERWTKNILVYQSPDGHVCECCKPSVAVQGPEVVVMFRNWLAGSRDLFLLRSSDQGATFTAPQKLGTGTWKLNGCPMDGGGVFVDVGNVANTTWQREGIVYYCKPGEMEMSIGKGRTCSIAGTARITIISMQTGDTVKVVKLPQKNEIVIGTGGFLKSIVPPDNKILCVWEQDNKIRFKKV